MTLIVYDPANDRFVKFHEKSYGEIASEIYEIKWMDYPLYYKVDHLFKVLSNLNIGQLRAINNTHVLWSTHEYHESVPLIDWFCEQLDKRGIPLTMDYEGIKNFR